MIEKIYRFSQKKSATDFYCFLSIKNGPSGGLAATIFEFLPSLSMVMSFNNLNAPVVALETANSAIIGKHPNKELLEVIDVPSSSKSSRCCICYETEDLGEGGLPTERVVYFAIAARQSPNGCVMLVVPVSSTDESIQSEQGSFEGTHTEALADITQRVQKRHPGLNPKIDYIRLD